MAPGLLSNEPRRHRCYTTGGTGGHRLEDAFVINVGTGALWIRWYSVLCIVI